MGYYFLSHKQIDMMKGLRQDLDQLTRHFSGKLKYVQVVLTFPLSDSLNSSCKIKKKAFVIVR